MMWWLMTDERLYQILFLPKIAPTQNVNKFLQAVVKVNLLCFWTESVKEVECLPFEFASAILACLDNNNNMMTMIR